MDLSPYQFKAPFDAFEFGTFAAGEAPDAIWVVMNWLDSHPEEEEEAPEMASI